MLSTHTCTRFPDLLAKIEQELVKAKSQVEQMPKPPSKEPISEVVRMVSDFAREIDKQTQGIPGKDGLLQKTHGLEEEFQLAIRKTVPDYRPYKRHEAQRPMPQPDFLGREEDAVAIIQQMPDKPIFIDEVMDQARW
jgi:hypothetical protein